MPEVELNSALKKFYDFAKDGYEFGNRNEVSNVTIGKNGHVYVSASSTDYRLKGWRNDVEKCANNVARLEFFKAVVAQFGSFDRIPENVLRAMKLLDYGDRAGMRELERTVEGKNPQADYVHAGSGKPLVARRILDVIEAIQKSPEALVNTVVKKLKNIAEANLEPAEKTLRVKTYLTRVFDIAFSPVVFRSRGVTTLPDKSRNEMMIQWLSAFDAQCHCAKEKFSKISAKYQFCEDVIANVREYWNNLLSGKFEDFLVKDHDIKGKSYAELEGASWARKLRTGEKSLSELHQKFVKDFLRAEGDDFVKGGCGRAIGRLLQCERKLGNAAGNETLVQAMQRLRADYEKCLEEFVPGTEGWHKCNDFLQGLFKDIPEVKQKSTLLEEEDVKVEPRKVVAKKNLLIEPESVQEEDEEEEIPKHPNKAPLIDAEAVEGRRLVTNYGVIWDKSKSLFNEMVLESEGGVPVIRALDDRNLDDRYIIKKNLDVVEARFSLIKEIVSALFGSEEQIDEGQVNNFVAELCLELSQEQIQNDKVQFFLQVSAVVDKLKAKMEQMPEGAAKIKCAAGIDAFAGAFDALVKNEDWNLSAEDYGRIFAGRYERNVKTQEDCRKFLTNHFELLLPRYGFSLKGETELNNKLQDVVAGVFQEGKPFGEAIEKLKGYFADCAKATIADPELREQKIDMFNAFLKGIRSKQEVIEEIDDSSDLSIELLLEEDVVFGENNVQEEQPRREVAANQGNPNPQEYFTIPPGSIDEENHAQGQPPQMEQPGGTGTARMDRPDANVPVKSQEEIEGENLVKELQGVRSLNRKRGMVRTHMNEFVEQKVRENLARMRQQFLALSFEELEFGEMMKKYHEIMRQSIRELPLEESEKRERLANFIKGYFKDFPLDD